MHTNLRFSTLPVNQMFWQQKRCQIVKDIYKTLLDLSNFDLKSIVGRQFVEAEINEIGLIH